MPMSNAERALYLKERARIAKEMGVPENEVVLLDVDTESAAWLQDPEIAGKEATLARAKAASAENREEGGE